MSDNHPNPAAADTPVRPARVVPVELATLAALIGADAPAADVLVGGVSLDSRAILPGDLYLALPGARSHGADFAEAAVAAGAVAVLSDADGAARLAGRVDVPVLVVPSPRKAAGTVAAAIYGTHASADSVPPSAPGSAPMALFGVTGTNGKTTTTYFINSLLQALGRGTGLIGTIEILAGNVAIPSKLTTPESTDVHALLALMRERGLGAASMEVSSHALEFGRVDGVVFDVAGFTNLTQDHLDLHGSMAGYAAVKAQLFTPSHARRAVVTVDDDWGLALAARATVPVATLRTTAASTQAGAAADAQWQVSGVEPAGLGSRFTLAGPDGVELALHTGLPGDFNVANAALAATMVLEQLTAAGGTLSEAAAQVQAAADAHDPFTVAVPGRMQLVAREPAAIVDFAHNPDALQRALGAVRSTDASSRVIVVFGATGQRDATKRPTMGAVAVRGADVVIVTDDDPHDEDAASIRAGVLAGARAAVAAEGLATVVEEVFPRADAIVRAVELAHARDTILVAGRGHEVLQEVQGVNLPLDDRVELRTALAARGFTPEPVAGIES
ncbi:Mur ligase family protein [Arthrobacter sp. 35W]|uniref:Mur ligase family protein n=1 Tax=Arthrobacter sp. 35W TaxID=1132441 RepID=UPI00040BCBB4|nr:UDP-N-acetylmuramoyl-L-alanyl-D-glutamate--2,6-diaminopimelate ligase [Arthrobacter sp. 35W]